jgi:hypothetical protein
MHVVPTYSLQVAELGLCNALAVLSSQRASCAQCQVPAAADLNVTRATACNLTAAVHGDAAQHNCRNCSSRSSCTTYAVTSDCTAVPVGVVWQLCTVAPFLGCSVSASARWPRHCCNSHCRVLVRKSQWCDMLCVLGFLKGIRAAALLLLLLQVVCVVAGTTCWPSSQEDPAHRCCLRCPHFTSSAHDRSITRVRANARITTGAAVQHWQSAGNFVVALAGRCCGPLLS